VGFLFAPSHHSALRHVAPSRRELGLHTIFNLLGPLTNPAGARYQLLGTFAGERLEQTARVLSRLGSRRAWVVHGRDGLDELSPCTASDVAELREDGSVRLFTLHPEDAGLERVPPESIAGGDVEDNARRSTPRRRSWWWARRPTSRKAPCGRWSRSTPAPRPPSWRRS
jgi:anthranilate phosphoribosyltransferase